MTVEQLCLYDLYLKSIPKYGLQNIMNIDNMLIVRATQKDFTLFKNAATNINNVKKYIDEKNLEDWENSLKKQIKESVDRAKYLKTKI